MAGNSSCPARPPPCEIDDSIRTKGTSEARSGDVDAAHLRRPSSPAAMEGRRTKARVTGVFSAAQPRGVAGTDAAASRQLVDAVERVVRECGSTGWCDADFGVRALAFAAGMHASVATTLVVRVRGLVGPIGLAGPHGRRKGPGHTREKRRNSAHAAEIQIKMFEL